MSALAPRSLIRYSDHVLGQGPEFFANAKRLGLEGIVSKRRSAPYRPGRTTDWLKSKAVHQQEFVVCGFILREGTKDQVGSLILGLRSTPGPKGQWVYAGQVGTGFHAGSSARTPYAAEEDGNEGLFISRNVAGPWQRPLGTAAREASCSLTGRRPELVCEVAFTEWTPEGTLRHPSFQGLREAKDPTDIIREG